MLIGFSNKNAKLLNYFFTGSILVICFRAENDQKWGIPYHMNAII